MKTEKVNKIEKLEKPSSILRELKVGGIAIFPMEQRNSIESTINRVRYKSPEKTFKITKIDDYKCAVTREDK